MLVSHSLHVHLPMVIKVVTEQVFESGSLAPESVLLTAVPSLTNHSFEKKVTLPTARPSLRPVLTQLYFSFYFSSLHLALPKIIEL